jgi:ankyrin repeat protein
VEAAADIVTALVERGANINALAPNGETVLHRAVRTRQHAMVELLIRLGADLSIASDSQGTPLHCAVQLGDDFIVQQLAAASGAPLNVISRSMSCAEACTPLYLAAAKGAAGMVKVLLAAGADASKGTHLGGVTPLHAALLGHHSGVAKQLLAAGADVNAVGQVVGTALVLALREGDQAMVEQLLAQGADPTLSSPGTVAPLTAAVISGNQKLLEQLLAAPAIQAATRAWQEQAPGNVTAVRHATGTAGGAGAAAAAAGAASSLGAESARPKRVQQHQGGSPLRRCNAMTPDQLELVAIPHGPHADGCHSSSSSSSSVSAIHDRMGAALLAAAEANAVDMVGMLRQAGASPNGRNAAGDALLHLAIAAADAAMVAQLLERGADPNLVGSEHVTPLCMAVAARDSRLVGLLLSAGARPDQGSNGNTPLAMAVRWGMAGIAKQLLGAGASIDYAGMDGLTPVWWAIKHSSVQMMELLMTPGAAVHLSSSNHETPLQGAVTVALRHGCFPEHLRVVSALLKAGADPNGYDQQGGTHSRPLHAAAAGGQVQLVELLVGAGASLDASSSRGTPLQLAVAAQAEQVVQALLAAGANPNACGSGGEEAASACHNASALELAMHKGPYAIVKALLAHGADPNAAHSSGQGTLLHAAVASSDRAAVEQLLAVGANPNAIRTTDGSTPLLLAVCQSDEAMVELLLAAGAQPNLVYSTHHITPLQHALLQRHQNLALKLLEAGADPNLGTGREVGMPLQLAIGQGPALVQVLLAAGAQPELADGYAVTALQLAVQQNLCQEVQLLLAKGADASVVDSISGDTLLHVAVRGDFSSMVELLVPTSADVNASNKRGYTPLMMALGDGHGLSSSRTWQLLLQHPRLDVNSGTPLHHAVRMGSTAAMHQLLQRGADPLAIDSKGYMPLHVAAAQGHLDIVQQLAAAGADVNAVAGRGQLGTPLQLAARGAYGEVVRWLLDHGAAASVSAATADGTTALHLACIRTGTEQMVTDLLGAGAEPGAANSSGNTPLHLAAAAGLQVTVGHLLAAGARAWVLNSNRELPLHLALAGGHSTLALQLIAAAKDADGVLNVISAAGMAPIHLAAVRQPSNILKELLCCKGLEVDVVDSAGQTALHKAAAGGHIDNLRQLVRHGASLDAADATGATPSHLAAAGVFGNCVRHLVTSGADKDAVDASGATPLHKAGAGVTPELVALLATPSNTSRVVDGTTLLHTAAAGDQEGLVSALLAAGAAAWQQDSRGESVLAMVARQGSTAMLRLLLRHLLWQHKVSGSADGALLPTEVLVALQQALAHDGEKSVWVFTTVMEVLGEGAASALWQELVQQHNPEQQQRWLGCIAVSALQEGLSAACVKLAGQQTSVTQPLEQALQGSIRQPGAATARPAAKQPLPQAAEALEGARGSAAAAAGVQRVFPTLATITAAAGLGQQQEVQGLLQQVPRAAQATALAEAAKAAGSGGHHQLCVQLVQRLAATHQGKALQVVQEVVAKLEGQPYQAVEVLGPSSLALCGALLGGWQAVRRQQQQEMVNGLVSAAVAWQQGQQLHKKRRQVT